MKYLSRFLWWSAGVNIDVLEKCPTEHAKYFGVGGTIVFTALMASFAGGYAFFTAFKSPILSIFFGAFWGLLIFNLDRYIVSTIGKGDGTQKITLEEWKIAAPRLIMAILLGLVISTPLELKIFETEIQTIVERLKIEKAEGLKNRDISFNTDFEELKGRRTVLDGNITELTNNKKQLAENAGAFYDERRAELQQDYKQRKGELSSAQSKLNSLYNNYMSAVNDSLGTKEISRREYLKNKQLKVRNRLREKKEKIGDEITALTENKGNAIKDEAVKIDKQLSILINEKETLLDKIGDMRKIKDEKTKNYDNKVENYDGFAAHLEAMGILTEEKSALFWAKWLITLLFIFIEIAPVLFKLMAESGPYDDVMDRIKHESYVREKQKISDINDEINTSIIISSAKNKARLDAELQANKDLLESIAKAQSEIAQLAVKKWQQEEEAKLHAGVNHIVNSNGSVNGNEKEPEENNTTTNV